VPVEVFMVNVLDPEAGATLRGRVEYPPEFSMLDV
jgi:hypothetical protein